MTILWVKELKKVVVSPLFFVTYGLLFWMIFFCYLFILTAWVNVHISPWRQKYLPGFGSFMQVFCTTRKYKFCQSRPSQSLFHFFFFIPILFALIYILPMTGGVWVNTGFILYSTSPFSFTFICLYLYLYLYSAYTCTASAYTPFCLLIKKTIYSVICSFSAFYQRHHLCF